MFDLSKIQDIEVKYEYKKLGLTSYYSEINDKNSRTIAPNKETIRLTIQDDNLSDDNGIYQVIIKNKGDQYEIKGDYFVSPEIWYEASAIINEDHVLIISEDADEKMTIICHIA
ncbi:hypothetical protein D3879_15720 [Pseudomonas cavernicola]|uniref:Uncharacterized protein n=1 Tax=Pseudomonas cavernicola TaxID=2320866 RepID=A0A418XF96_9PSED|nr:hypothetical protein [Pseudomonas cavernicola]RJG11107.1 hypothetical protein D3879_15720 [Pseudomonas cavernicola]